MLADGVDLSGRRGEGPHKEWKARSRQPAARSPQPTLPLRPNDPTRPAPGGRLPVPAVVATTATVRTGTPAQVQRGCLLVWLVLCNELCSAHRVLHTALYTVLCISRSRFEKKEAGSAIPTFRRSSARCP
jgi:hypothetical protein